jgi:integrase/recombinase XerC
LEKLIKFKSREFLAYLEDVRGYSDLTIKSYDETLREAFLYIEIIQEKKHLLFNLMPYRIKISSLNPKTISKKLSAIRQLF